MPIQNNWSHRVSLLKLFQTVKMIGDSAGLVRELQAILTLYIGTLLGGFSMGFSAVTIPDIKQEWKMRENKTSFFIPAIEALNEDLSWFGRIFTFHLLA